ncbi:MAG: glycogen synthase GlgA [Candidatus Zixiibacteriota bacterium]
MAAGLNILFLSSEVVPFSKSGGLADVAGALPAALRARGHRVTVATPLYRKPSDPQTPPTRDDEAITIPVTAGDQSYPMTIRPLDDESHPVTVCFADNADLFAREGLYGAAAGDRGYNDYDDNDVRFSVFVRSVLEWVNFTRQRFDIIHANDWQTALACAYLSIYYHANPLLNEARSVLTIHNLAYQGVFPASRFGVLGLDPGYFAPMSPFEFFEKINFLKAGIHYATKINTVSPTYAYEIQHDEELGSGLDGALRKRTEDLSGILNGIDYSVWHPSTDALIDTMYTADVVDEGKRANKRALLKRAGIAPERWERPLIGIISRLADQKGFDLIAESLEDFIALDFNLILLGTGEQRFHKVFSEWNANHPECCRAYLTFDDPLAHQIEAGSDMFLMPSRYEPCGLNQLYSLAYGTVPIVRHTGGLADTVIDADLNPNTGTGFVFEEYSAEAMVNAIARALRAYRNPQRWVAIRARGMASDFSWARSAAQYEDLYERSLRVDAATAFYHH